MKRYFLSATAIATFTSPAALLMPSTGWSQIEEVVVTSRRKSENLQEIPVAVAAFGSEVLDQQGLRNTQDIVKLVPGVQFDQSFSAADTRISMRGINASRGRASVAVLVDGVDISGENITAGGGGSLLNTALLDIERVEVVKGPQSALYGRNAFAGAINYITKKPNLEETEGSIGIDVGEYGKRELRGSISGPVIDDVLALSLNVVSYNLDGYYEDPNSGADLNGAESKGVRLGALYVVNDDITVTGSISYSDDESTPRAVVKVGNANTFYLDGMQLPTGTTAEFSLLGNQDYGQWLGDVDSVKERNINLSQSERTGGDFKGSEDERIQAHIVVDWDLGDMQLKSTTAYLDNKASLQEDVDFQNGLGTFFMGVGLSLDNDYQDETDTEQFSQEFVLSSDAWSKGNWLVGASFLNEDVKNTDMSIGWYNDPNTAFIPNFCAGSGPFGTLSCSFNDSLAASMPNKTIQRETDSLSIFGLIGIDITEKLRTTFEARYIKDEIEVTTNTTVDSVSQYLLGFPFNTSFTGPIALPSSDEVRTETVNPRLAFDYQANDDVLWYASIAKGTKPGGFGTAGMALPSDARMEEEELWSYELGFKSTLRDRSIRLNAAVFFNDYKNRQVGVTINSLVSGFPASGVVNAGAAETKGFEADILWMATEKLSLGLAYAYTDAEWTDFDYSEIRQAGANDTDRAICGNSQGDCSGAPIAGIPENALTLVVNYTAPLNDQTDWFVNLSSQYTDERAVADQVETPFIKASWNVDLQAGLQSDKWSVTLYADNLLDDDTVDWGQSYQDFRDGMYGGNNGGEPRDETVMAFLPNPRIVGVRANWNW